MGCTLTLHVQANTIVAVDSPLHLEKSHLRPLCSLWEGFKFVTSKRNHKDRSRAVFFIFSNLTGRLARPGSEI